MYYFLYFLFAILLFSGCQYLPYAGPSFNLQNNQSSNTNIQTTIIGNNNSVNIEQ